MLEGNVLQITLQMLQDLDSIEMFIRLKKRGFENIKNTGQNNISTTKM